MIYIVLISPGDESPFGREVKACLMVVIFIQLQGHYPKPQDTILITVADNSLKKIPSEGAQKAGGRF